MDTGCERTPCPISAFLEGTFQIQDSGSESSTKTILKCKTTKVSHSDIDNQLSVTFYDSFNMDIDGGKLVLRFHPDIEISCPEYYRTLSKSDAASY